MPANETRNNLVLLNLTGLVGSATYRKLAAAFGTIDAALRAPLSHLQSVSGIGPAIAGALTEIRTKGLLAKEFDLALEMGVEIATIEDDTYPEQLRNIYDPPLALYIKGKLQESDDVSIGVVGSRRCTAYGIRQAEQFSARLAERGITVISGLARGVDTIAHRGALKTKGGRTIAVLGSGLNKIYPPENSGLFEQVCARGAAISEFGLNTTPEPANFPRRNRIISGLSSGVLVVEAAERSGALITADWALEQGKEVFCIPGSIDNSMSRGCHQLIRYGAKLVETVDDIMDELPPYIQERFGYVVRPRMNTTERMVLETLSAKPASVESIASARKLPLPFVTEALDRLEAKGLARRDASGNYTGGD